MITTNSVDLNAPIFLSRGEIILNFFWTASIIFFKAIAQSYLLSTVDRETKPNIRQKGMFLTAD